ncbi:MAG TPA: Ig-like domain repeat protein [Terriglobales bacterium]|jgi:subtilase family serine protease|nr:Ig-like domain repeat protein [Terriglobales bacterium]
MSSVPARGRFAIGFVCLLLSVVAAAQQIYVHPRVNEPIDEGRLVPLQNNIHPLARPQFDVAVAPPNLPMERMLLLLKRSPEQDTALLKLLDDQQDKYSANYHKWLTPEQFGQQFGPADADVQTVTAWLQSHGFEVAKVSPGRVAIEFSGTAAQVQEAFHTAIHKYVVNGEAHWANASDPEIPAALAPVVLGVHSLHNFYAKPLIVMSDQRFSITRHAGARPHATGANGFHALAPDDYAVIYNINPVYQSGIDGSGTTIAVVGRSNFSLQDVVDFRNSLGLSANFPEIILDGSPPDDLGGSEEAEAILDATWAGAVARNANVKFVLSASTNTTDGIVLSELYIIENNVGDVMSESFGGCEAAITSSEAAGFAGLAQEAAAQGITYTVGTGDTGAAGCDNLGETVAAGPVTVSVLASTPFTVAVGGTMFNENGHDSTYWNATNSATLASVKSYIPENVWNETCTTQCSAQAAPLAAGGGGASVYFSKPPWQTGVAGIPTDGVRDLPDVSLTAASHDPYLLCIGGSCESEGFFGVSGTSASAPSFAGIMALIDQKTGSRQGQADYILYRLATAETLSQCNGSKTTALPAATCVFNDVTVGNNAVPGEAGYGAPGAQYQSTVGYDLASGLGSVNVANLVNNWNSVTFRPTTTTLNLTPLTFTHGSPANVSVAVAPNSGGGTATGDVSLLTNLPGSVQGVAFLTLSAGASTGNSDGLPGGTYQVHAHYAGDATFAASDSAPVTITVSPENSTTTLSVLGFDAGGNVIPFISQPYGNPAYFRADVSGLSGNGVATGTVSFSGSGLNFPQNPYSLNSEGAAATSLGIFTIPPGQHAVMAAYSGDPGFNPSASAATNFTVTQAPTTSTVVPSGTTMVSGTAVTLAATIATTSGGLAPGGTATFLSGGVPIAAAVALNGSDGSGSIQSGVFQAAQAAAALTIALPAGQDSITVQYSGDSNYLASTSAAVVVNVLADFAFSAGSPAITIPSPGGSGTATLTVTGQPGYNATINFPAASCAGLPRESLCSFNPPSITGSGSTTLTISTTAPRSARLEGGSWWATGAGGTLAAIFLLGGGSKRRTWNRFLALIAVACLINIVSCGGASSSSGGSGDPGTPAGSSTVTITAATTAGSPSHTATLTLNVQ